MTSNARAGTRILGSLRSADGKGVVRVEDRFDTTSTTCGRHSRIPCVSPRSATRDASAAPGSRTARAMYLDRYVPDRLP